MLSVWYAYNKLIRSTNSWLKAARQSCTVSSSVYGRGEQASRPVRGHSRPATSASGVYGAALAENVGGSRAEHGPAEQATESAPAALSAWRVNG